MYVYVETDVSNYLQNFLGANASCNFNDSMLTSMTVPISHLHFSSYGIHKTD